MTGVFRPMWRPPVPAQRRLFIGTAAVAQPPSPRSLVYPATVWLDRAWLRS